MFDVSNDLRRHSPDTNRELKTCLIEEYANEEKSTDGEIYCKIRQYHFQQNLGFEQRWWTWLTPQKSKNLKQLLRHDGYRAAFDAFLHVPSLLEEGLMLGIWHKVAAVRCDEVRGAVYRFRPLISK